VVYKLRLQGDYGFRVWVTDTGFRVYDMELRVMGLGVMVGVHGVDFRI
jgi:hypothetical protein